MLKRLCACVPLIALAVSCGSQTYDSEMNFREGTVANNDEQPNSNDEEPTNLVSSEDQSPATLPKGTKFKPKATLPKICTEQSPSCYLLNVPYLYQYKNPIGVCNASGGNTCQVTALAMLLQYYGVKLQPKDFYIQREEAKSAEGAATIIAGILGYGWWTQSGTRAEIKAVLRSGRPAIINTWLTHGGHVVLITGYNEKGFIFNDPAGRWKEVAREGYNYHGDAPGHDQDGHNITYPYSTLTDEAIGADNSISFASGDTEKINLGFGHNVEKEHS